MPRLAANLSLLFEEWPFLDRFEAAARCGFEAVEFLFPYEYSAATVARALREARLQAALFNLPPGDWQAGERGLAALPGREREFADAAARALDYARATSCRRLHAMAGVPGPGTDPAECDAVMVSNLRHAAALFAPHGISVLIEPINRGDMPGYHLDTLAHAERLRIASGADNVRLQFDCYHCRIVEGDPGARLRRHLHAIEHIQIAGVPERHEPDSGEVDYHSLFALLDELGYSGWVGCEYRPRAGTLAGLAWATPWGIDPAGAASRDER